MPHNWATTDPEECTLLNDIVRNLAAPKPLQTYAAWLKTRDPSAAQAVHTMAIHLTQGGPLPHQIENRSQSWHRMLGWGAFEGKRSWANATRQLTEEQRGVLAGWVRPVISMTAQACEPAELPLGASHFLGAPDLPADFVWPTCARGPLRFQAQIDLSDIAPSVATKNYGVPADGHLLLFAFDDDYNEGIQPGVVERTAQGGYVEIPDLTHVAYLPASSALERRPIPSETAQCDGSDGTCRITFAEQLDLPPEGDIEDPRLDEEAMHPLEDFNRDWTHKLMGYPVHGRTSNTSPGPDWLNLITLGSDDPTGWCWCDGEHLDVYVHSEGLRSRSFKPFYGYAA